MPGTMLNTAYLGTHGQAIPRNYIQCSRMNSSERVCLSRLSASIIKF